jgi:hypothetical protein
LCGRRQWLIPRFKRKDASHTYRFELQVLRLLIGSNEDEVARRLAISAETVARIVRNQVADAGAKEVDPTRAVTDVGVDELSLKKRHKLYVTILTDLSDPDRPEGGPWRRAATRPPPGSAWGSCRRRSGSGCGPTGRTGPRPSTTPVGSCCPRPARWWTASMWPESSTRSTTATGKSYDGKVGWWG